MEPHWEAQVMDNTFSIIRLSILNFNTTDLHSALFYLAKCLNAELEQMYQRATLLSTHFLLIRFHRLAQQLTLSARLQFTLTPAGVAEHKELNGDSCSWTGIKVTTIIWSEADINWIKML